MSSKLILMLVCLGFSSGASAGTPGGAPGGVSFDRGVDVSGFMLAAAAAEIKIPEAAPVAAAEEFQTMGRHEGGRVDDLQAVVSIETQIAANGAPGFVQFEMAYPEIPKDKPALAVDPKALVMTVNIPVKDYPAIFEGDQFLMTGWDFGGKSVAVYSSYDGRTRFVQITQTTRNPSGGLLTTEVVKLIVAGNEISMGQVEKFSSGSDVPYFSEYIVMATKVSAGLALKNPDTVGRISEPSLIKYVAESPTPERIREVLGQ